MRVGGESALRFDVPTLRLHVFGASLFINELFLVLAAVLGLTFLLLWVTVVYGRVWCGWLCPQTLLTDLTTRHGRAGFPAKPGAATHLLMAALSLLVGAASVWYSCRRRRLSEASPTARSTPSPRGPGRRSRS